jgi:hypothetical protein
MEHSPAIKNILDIFDIIGILTSNSFELDKIYVLGSNVVTSLAERGGLVPPSESTITLHELCHVTDQSTVIGCPRHNNLYKFEKVNKFLKNMLKNVAKGFASIIKNYMEKESIFFESALSLTEIENIKNLNKFFPRNSLGMKSLSSYLQPLYVDSDDEKIIIYDIPNSNVVQLNGEMKTYKLNKILFAYILHDAMTYPNASAPDNSLLKMLYNDWLGGKGVKKPENFLNFLSVSMNSKSTLTTKSIYIKYLNYIDTITDENVKNQFIEDVGFLSYHFTPADNSEFPPDDYLLITYDVI